MSLADRIRTVRQAKRLTLAKLGAAIDPPRGRTAVCEWEQGRCEPSLATVEQLAAVLGVSPCWLAFGVIHHEKRSIMGRCSKTTSGRLRRQHGRDALH